MCDWLLNRRQGTLLLAFIHEYSKKRIKPPNTPLPTVQQPLVGQGLIIEASRSHSNTPQSVGLL